MTLMSRFLLLNEKTYSMKSVVQFTNNYWVTGLNQSDKCLIKLKLQELLLFLVFL